MNCMRGCSRGSRAAGLVLAVPEDEQAKFDKLWAGDTSSYDNNHSRADLALCCILARRCKNNFLGD